MLLKEPHSPAHPILLSPTPSAPTHHLNLFSVSWSCSIHANPGEQQQAMTHSWGPGGHLPWLMDRETEAQGGQRGFVMELPESEPGRSQTHKA